ncbi:MAG: hypothetical protein IPK16_22690 [Anaerolineales bacterium]|nr:hypothetical protein [Anaerolineales bacterium]
MLSGVLPARYTNQDNLRHGQVLNALAVIMRDRELNRLDPGELGLMEFVVEAWLADRLHIQFNGQMVQEWAGQIEGDDPVLRGFDDEEAPAGAIHHGVDDDRAGNARCLCYDAADLFGVMHLGFNHDGHVDIGELRSNGACQ